MADASEVGNFGTIRLLKRREPSTVVASYPIDEEEVTFGRDPSCSVRLYYQGVSSFHCKIVFEERKAFLQVLGVNGVVVDGCQVYPAKPDSTPTTVPLPNGSTFEIHKKRFIFNYPPKELRPQLFTPGVKVKRRGSLRMSMIQSAHVFSPAPSPNPRDNLRVLQSPLKLASMDEDDPVTLVDGNHPRVFEEGQDLIILEDIELKFTSDPEMQTPTRSQTMQSLPQTQVPASKKLPQPQTPRRRSVPSLHRAVLIRSAQRVAYLREMQVQRQRIEYGNQFEDINLDEEAAEEEEVEESVIGDIVNDDSEEVGPDVVADVGVQGDGIIGDEDIENAEYEEGDEQDDEQDITEARDGYQEEREETSAVQYSTPLQVSRTRQLGAFMTPQAGLFAQRPPKEEDDGQRQKTGPQRPPPGYRFSLAPGLGAGTLSLRDKPKEADAEVKVARPPSPTKPRLEISEEERKAILERRKSALKAPDPEFADHIPGLGARRTSALPPSGPSVPTSPFKSIREDIDDGENTRSVLKRMEDSLAGMRRKSLARQSIGVGRNAGLPPSPEKGFSLLASGSGPSPMRGRFEGRMQLRFGEDMIMEETGSQLKKEEEDMRNDMTADANKSKGKDGLKMEVENEEEDEQDENIFRPRLPLQMPGTPRMDGLRNMFRVPQAPVGLLTPAVRGVRELFREKTAAIVPQTPRMDGIRSLFIEQRIPATPAFDGIAEMMQLDGDEGEPDLGKEDNEEGDKMPVDIPKDIVDDIQPEDRKADPLPAPRPTVRGKETRIVRGTPDMSTMADDEATPDLGIVPVPKGQLASRAGKAGEAAVVHRTTRVRKVAGAGSDTEEPAKTKASAAAVKRAAKDAEDNATEESEKPAKTAVRRGRPPKAVADSDETDAKAAKAKPKGRPRKPESVSNVAPKTARKGASEDDSSAPVVAKAPTALRRGTRARSQSVDRESELGAGTNDDPLDSTGRSSPDGASSSSATTKAKRSVRTKAATVETIPEEDEPVQVKPLRKSTLAAAARVRKARADAEGTQDSVLQKKKAVASQKAAKTQEPTDDDDSMDKEDKENTPERSPVSPIEPDEDVPVKTSRSRAAPKTAATTKARTVATKATKPPLRTMKVKEEEPTVPLRTTRTRARK
ncbi:hypothetical protein EW145_g2328 [Phellinidium pouzarii]|uniref:FHA domain-containing protein n=1 Tax=Phellinidium pouzarii TaxID=167371 RepID=A0A4S4LD88_9AGAM|nr:hypothetical protein EW145_g2328 [Phellinidium pouzarii]